MKAIILGAAIGVFALPVKAADPFSGSWAAACPGRHVCTMQVAPDGNNRWAIDIQIFTKTGAEPICRRSFSVRIGGPEGILVPGIASGLIDGHLVGLLDRGDHLEIRAQTSCGSVPMSGIYNMVGD